MLTCKLARKVNILIVLAFLLLYTAMLSTIRQEDAQIRSEIEELRAMLRNYPEDAVEPQGEV